MRHRSLVHVGLAGLLVLASCAPADSSEGGSGGAGVGTGGRMGTGGGSPGSGGAGPPGTGGSGSGGQQGPSGSGGVGTGGAATGSGGRAGGGGVTGTGGADAGSGGVGGAGRGGNGGNGGRVGSGGSAAGGSAGAAQPGASGLPVPPGPANVAKPSGTPGNITVLNWAGFKGAVSYTFDDSNTTQIQNYAAMQALGVPFTFYVWTGKSESSNSIWATAVKDGHELGNHTKSHSSNGTVADIDAATEFLMMKWGVMPWTFAAPNGAGVYTSLTKDKFLLNRGVANRVILPNDNTDPFTLPSYIPPTGASASAFNTQMDQARTMGGWRTVCLHGFTGGSDGAYQPVPFNEFVASVNYVKSLGDMWIGTMENVGAYWRGQKAFSQATTTTMGNDKTWTWTLPPSFPPKKYLRVTVPGGTVKQNGVEVPWDGHGYYEIALDARSVTVSP